MKNKVTVSLISTGNSEYRTFEVHLGSSFTLEVYEGDDKLTESIESGRVSVGVPAAAKEVFIKHGLFALNSKSNPELMKLLHKVFIDQNEKGFKEKSLHCREKTVVLKKDRNIKKLLNDNSFKRLDKACRTKFGSESQM